MMSKLFYTTEQVYLRVYALCAICGYTNIFAESIYYITIFAAQLINYY